MRTGYALFALIGLGLIFDVPMWRKSSDIKPEEYSYILLTQEDSVRAIDSYRKNLHLNQSGFYNDFFPASNQKLTTKTYVWFIIAFVTIAIITFFWSKEASYDSKPFVIVFLFFLIGDLVDFLIHYNENYNSYLSYNILFTGLYALFLGYMSIRKSEWTQ